MALRDDRRKILSKLESLAKKFYLVRDSQRPLIDKEAKELVETKYPPSKTGLATWFMNIYRDTKERYSRNITQET